MKSKDIFSIEALYTVLCISTKAIFWININTIIINIIIIKIKTLVLNMSQIAIGIYLKTYEWSNMCRAAIFSVG